MNIEDTLRDALQGDAAELQPVGPGPEHARTRAFRRKRRLQSGVVALGAVALVGGTLGVIETRPSGQAPQVRTQPVAGAPTADLAFKTVDGTVLWTLHQFTTAGGVTYAISTAPGAKGNPNGVDPQELYSTSDGVKWSSTSLGEKPWVADLTESEGVLYALGTGPGAQAGTTDYKLSTSTDGGAQWDDSSIPVSFTPPKSDVPLQPSTSVHVARGDHTTVVMAKTSYWADVSKVLGKDVATHATDAGVEVYDMAACQAQRKVAASGGTDPASVPPGACDKKVVATHPWSDFGISDPAALHQQKAVVKDDGGSWRTIDLPNASDTSVSDIAATSNGFVMVESTYGTGPASAQIWTSGDGRSWSQMSQVPAFDNVSISGNRMIGVDNTSSKLYVSNDAGSSWIAAPDVAGLIPGSDAIEPYNTTADVGPLGYAVVVRTTGSEGAAEKVGASGTPNTLAPPSNAEVLSHTYLLHSSDGVSWKVTNLADAGAPSDGSMSTMNVGADHIDVTFEVPQTGSDGAVGSFKLVTLVATPKA
jgi:hypothetical protein